MLRREVHLLSGIDLQVVQLDGVVALIWWGGRLTPCSIIRRGDRTLIRWYETGVEELFDLRADPAETWDLAAEQPEVAAELAALLDVWLATTDARLPADPMQVPEPRWPGAREPRACVALGRYA